MAEELALRSPLALFLNLVDLFFPPRCVGGCKREGQWLCGSCSETLISSDFHKQAHFYNLEPTIPEAALFDFNQPLIRELLHTLKHNGI